MTNWLLSSTWSIAIDLWVLTCLAVVFLFAALFSQRSTFLSFYWMGLLIASISISYGLYLSSSSGATFDAILVFLVSVQFVFCCYVFFIVIDTAKRFGEAKRVSAKGLNTTDVELHNTDSKIPACSAGAMQHYNASVLFFDMSNFTGLVSNYTDLQQVELLNTLYSAFDEILMRYGVERLKTNGDQYIAVAGVPLSNSSHNQLNMSNAVLLCEVALLLLNQFGKICQRYQINCGARFGIASGAVVSGQIGKLQPCRDVWGVPMIVAARLETTCKPNHIHICQTTHDLLPNDFKCDTRGTIWLKGLGNAYTYWLREKSNAYTPFLISH